MLYLCTRFRKRQKMKKILFLICLVLLAACHKDDDNETVQQTRTVLIYMSAENKLSYDSEYDLAEIYTGSKSLSENDNLLVYCDRAKKDELPWLARIVDGRLQDSVSIVDMQIYDEDYYSSYGVIFEKVLSYAFSHYPATGGYGLTLWGHANGWLKMDSLVYTRAYGVDNGTNSAQTDVGLWLNMPTIRRVLEKQPHLDFILADCCNFMCLESLYELRNAADYIVGSPAEIPAAGAPYDKMVPEMFKRQYAAKSIMTAYANAYKDYLPLSVVKLSEMDAVAAATNKVLKAIYSRLDTEYPEMAGLIHYYNERKASYLPAYNIFYDAGDFILRFAEEEEYKEWKQVLDRAVTDKVIAPTWEVNKNWSTHYSDFKMTEERYHGVSMFVPQELGYYVQYNEDIKDLLWYWKVWK